MKALACTLLLATSALVSAQDFQITEDSKPHDNVPKGEVLKFVFNESKIFPGTTRNVTVYVPKQYDPAKPACVWVHQDGVQYNAPVVFDNLIAKGDMPVTIYIAASPGVVKALDPAKALDRYNRSYEYDGLGPNYASFVLGELLPFVEKQKTSDGRAIVLSKNGNDRCIGGESSGAVCAFTAAWERPAEFRRVYSNIGTYVGLRGADRYPTLLRKFEPKPLRVFLQDGENDLNIYAGDWWMANQTMERALTWSGYEVSHVWGKGEHNGKDATATFPDAVRWIWKDWPKEPQNSGTKNPFLNEILIPGEGWQEVKEKFGFIDDLIANPKGEVFFNEYAAGKAYRVDPAGKLSSSKEKGPVRYRVVAADGRMYSHAQDNTILGGNLASYDDKGAEAAVIKGATTGIGLPDGGFYVISTANALREIAYISPKGEQRTIDWKSDDSFFPVPLDLFSTLALSPDKSLLYVSADGSVFVYQIQQDGGLKFGQRFFRLHEHDDHQSNAGSLAVDADGRLYALTSQGIQVCDQAGRANCIIPLPAGSVPQQMVFGGENFDTVYVTTLNKVYTRKLKVKGVPSFAPAVKPAKPKL